MGWFMPRMRDNMVGECLALAQALEVVRYYLGGGSDSSARDDTTSTTTRAVKVSILSDAYKVLEWIEGKIPQKPTHANAADFVRSKSLEMHGIPGFDVSIELYWVPGHLSVEGNDHADHTSWRARELQRNVFATDLVEKDDPGVGNDSPSWMPRAVHPMLEREYDPLEREAVSRAPVVFVPPRYPWDPSPHRLRHPGRVLTLSPADDLMIMLQLEEDRERWENHRRRDMADLNLIQMQLEEDFQLWEAQRRRQELINQQATQLQPEEETQ
ncbi:hypothetical protein B0T20DRAFT_401705 [Sordaria brevicollis]|uniref:RNase H type-1 domain-containing protein n=1 Tax=Sordaria brevicollis TaxID=83679 RepID=A0AAE0PJZ4_SORBR|nr:hypothetical protein B0T20DRAFT_401705 [Sordaria brevicollis]